MFGSPALLDRVAAMGMTHAVKLSSLKRVISAGAPVSAAVLERFTALLSPDAEIFTPYGATEALPVSSIGSREILAETSHLTGQGRHLRRTSGCRTLPAIIPISDEPISQWEDTLSLPSCEDGRDNGSGATGDQRVPQPAGGDAPRKDTASAGGLLAPDGRCRLP